MELKILTLDQELELIKNLRSEDFLGAGSSRAVYEYGENKVLKLAISAEGTRQNFLEKSRYEEYGDSSFARIYEAGLYILISERVTVFDGEYYVSRYYDLTGCYADIEDDQGLDQEILSIGQEVSDLKDWLDDLSGYTDDNFQIGKGQDGRIVAYDYGYQPGVDNALQVANMRDWSCCETFLEIAYKVISASELEPFNRLDVDDFF